MISDSSQNTDSPSMISGPEMSSDTSNDTVATKEDNNIVESKDGVVGQGEDDSGDLGKDVHEPNILVPYQMLWLVGLENWTLIAIGCLCSLVSGAVPLIFYLLIGNLINLLAPGTPIEPSYSRVVRGASSLLKGAVFQSAVSDLLKYMGIIVVIAFAVNAISTFVLTLANDRIGMKLRNYYFSALVKQEIGFFDITRTGKILNHMTDDITRIQDTLTYKSGKCCEFGAQGIVGVILAFIISWLLTLIMLSSGPVIAVFGSIAAGLNDVFTKRSNAVSATATSIVNEVVGAMRTVRSMAGEEKEEKRFQRNLRKIIFLSFGKASILATLVGLIIGVAWSATVITFWYGGKLVHRGTTTIGDLLQVLGMVTLGVVGASQAMTIFPDFAKATAAAKALLKVILRKPAIRFSGGEAPEKIIGDIEFSNITFSYPSRPDVQVLKDFCLTIRAGQNVALVGQSGSGKSTIVGLLERFYETSEGRVLLDGVDIKDIDPQWLHRHIGIVTQEPTLFATSIKKNITYAISQFGSITDEAIIQAAKDANAHDFIVQLPDGYDTMLGERGVSLSGGQKQRIAIARAMIQNPSVLLLDEATSALDTESESLVQDALSKLMKGRTSIVIAHRLSTVQNADVIVVMSHGRIVEMGQHSELVQLENGVYAKLAQKQMRFGVDEEEDD